MVAFNIIQDENYKNWLQLDRATVKYRLPCSMKYSVTEFMCTKCNRQWTNSFPAVFVGMSVLTLALCARLSWLLVGF